MPPHRGRWEGAGAEMNIKLRPFNVPNFAIKEAKPGRRQDGMTQPQSFHLSEVDADTLSEMCDEFRAAVFAKAKTTDPRKATP